jgi:hypothetical protein
MARHNTVASLPKHKRIVFHCQMDELEVSAAIEIFFVGLARLNVFGVIDISCCNAFTNISIESSAKSDSESCSE